MSLTNKEIEALRLRLQRVAALAVNADEAKVAFGDIDALCAAARQPESLVGRRVRVKSSLGDFGDDNKMTITCGPLWLVESPRRSMTLRRFEFELLEDTNAK